MPSAGIQWCQAQTDRLSTRAGTPPRLLILDEVFSGLDLLIAAQI